jgi:nucleoside-diphosphate-sugar epimerase
MAPVRVDLAEPSYLYNLTKLTGEALCLALNNEKVRIARLSNVTALNPRSHLFLPTIIRNALEQRPIDLYVTPDSAKDYVLLEDAVNLILRIARTGARRIYNVASGGNTTAGEIVAMLQSRTGCQARWRDGATRTVFAPIDISLIKKEFGFQPQSIFDRLPQIIEATRRALSPASLVK